MDENEFWLDFFQSLALNLSFDRDATPKDIQDHIMKCSEIADAATAEATRKGRLAKWG